MKARALMHELLGQLPASLYGDGWCAYCGVRCYGRACRAHKDLPQLEAQAATDPVTPARTNLSKGA